jgi:hypothetical protein
MGKHVCALSAAHDPLRWLRADRLPTGADVLRPFRHGAHGDVGTSLLMRQFINGPIIKPMFDDQSLNGRKLADLLESASEIRDRVFEHNAD